MLMKLNMKPLKTHAIAGLSGLSMGLEASKDTLVSFTKVLNNDLNPNAVDKFMDFAAGRGHRIVHGHDFSFIPKIFDKFGIEGVGDYFKHLAKDISSPDGIPLPYAKNISELLGLNTLESIDWLCLNIGDVIGGSLSVYTSYKLKKAIKNGELDTKKAQILLGLALIKIGLVIYSPNPISLTSGIYDLVLLIKFLSKEFDLQIDIRELKTLIASKPLLKA